MLQRASLDLNGKKMKLSYSSVVSVLPVNEVFWKNHCRSPFNVIRSNSRGRRRLSSCSQKCRVVSGKVEMVAEKYLPPWFR